MDPDSNYSWDENDEKIYPQSSFMAMNYKGEIQCVVGGIGEKTESLAFNRATMAKKTAGFLYETGINLRAGVVQRSHSLGKHV